MAVEFEYDDTRLMRLFDELDPKRRRQALRGAFRQTARAVREAAVENLRATGLASSRHVERGIRIVMLKRGQAGFRVTVGTKRRRAKGEGTTAAEKRRRRLAIVPLWAETGTTERYTRKGRYRGAMGQRSFMGKTKSDMSPRVERMMKEAIVGNIESTAVKYGCRI